VTHLYPGVSTEKRAVTIKGEVCPPLLIKEWQAKIIEKAKFKEGNTILVNIALFSIVYCV
jgi:hypothetical protein